MTAEAHPPAHLLAELADGMVDDDVQAHVEQCPACQQVIEQLDQVTAALRDLPAEVAVPEFVSARISAALAAERAAADTVPAAAVPADSGVTVAWFRRRVPQVLAAAASVAVIGLAGYVAVTTTGNGGDSGSAGEMTAADAGSQSDADDSAGAPRLQREDDAESGPADMEALEGAGIDREELADAVEDVYRERTEFVATCGQELGEELGQPVVGSDAAGSGVLVVLEDADDAQLDGWLIPTCHSLTNEALDDPVVVPIPE